MNKKNIEPLENLLEKLKSNPGFPKGKDEDILALSDPPYYTACPNPYINDFIKEYGKPYDEENDDYERTPFVADVSEGKNDPVYNAHSYHTKVPYKAIMKYIEHYTDEGDIVFDGFCGTGMTGVAAQMLNRKAILSDLSPVASFIAYNYNSKIDSDEFKKEAEKILSQVEEECGWMYETEHKDASFDIFKKNASKEDISAKGKINYTVWSDVFICPFCNSEHVFWKEAVDKENGKVLEAYKCPGCDAEIKKTDCKRSEILFFDKILGKEITQAKQVPVLINYTYGNKRFEKAPDEKDLDLIKKIDESDIPYWVPHERMPEGDESRRNDRTGITHVHHFYTKRNLWILASIYNRCSNSFLKLWFTSAIIRLTKMYKYMPTLSKKGFLTDRRTGTVSGTLYIPSMQDENSPFVLFKSKINDLKKIQDISYTDSCISTNSASSLKIKNNSVDYVFTDPPFGSNLMYSELNFLWESWLKVFTNNGTEAVINKSQSKGLSEYSELMYKSFKECFRILKPKRWITVEFHNSKSNIWNAIQESLLKAGFVVSNVSVLDKKQGSFKQVTTSMAVSKDLVISAYKPNEEFTKRFLENAGHDLEKEFIKMHLSQLNIEPSVERTEQMLYSKMLSYYVLRGYSIKYNSSSFFKMLHENFIEADGFWFNPDQIGEYHEYKKETKLKDIEDGFSKNMIFFVSDEKSAIIWLNTFLDIPKNYSEILTGFNKVATSIDDDMPELENILNENFILEDGKYRRPRTEKEKVPVAEKREKALLKEFESLLFEAQNTKRKKIKTCRKEALKAGFDHCYKKERFKDILLVAEKLDKQIIENNSEINEFIEVAELKLEGL